MTLVRLAELFSNALGIALIFRLLYLRLHSVYRVFCLFLLYELLASSVFLYEILAHDARLDYRLTWIAMRVTAWVLSLWMVYALLTAVLEKLPGILRFSRKLLNWAFPIAIVIALLTISPEYSASGLSDSVQPIARAVGVAFILERVIATVCVLVLLGILGFILWFPVQMPRNLAVFSLGYVIYFGSETALLLIRSIWPQQNLNGAISVATSFVLSACFIAWLLLINKKGEAVPVRIGHRWQLQEQKRLIGQLESMNAALLRAARR
jgi:hypothetical protein